jgi:hypothetical protein
MIRTLSIFGILLGFLLIAGAAFGQYTITSQQPVTSPFYPGTFWTTPLPANVGSHCLTNVACTSSDPGTAIVNHIFGNSDSINFNSFSLMCLNPSDCTNSYNNSFYYASAADPVFRVNAGSGPCPNGPNHTLANCAAGKYFHLPSGAKYDAVPVTQGDQALTVWDLSSDIDPTPLGRILSAYFSTTGPRSLPTNCTATTPAQADLQSQCQLTLVANGLNFPYRDALAWGNGIESDGAANNANFLREQEIMQGSVNHALGLDTACLRSSSGNGVADPPVFPATGNAIGCSTNDPLRPLNGNLFWIDSGYNCSTLPPFQAPVCKAMQTFGGYVHATQGGSSVPLYVEPLEGGMAHQVANVSDPFFNNWIIANSTFTSCSGGFPRLCTGYNVGGQPSLEVQEDSASTSEKVIAYFMQMPGLITGHHLHILDPCVPLGLAGRPGGCVTGAAAKPTFSPVAGTYSAVQSVTITSINSSGPGPGAIICYNFTGAPATNGTTGCSVGTLYTGPVSIAVTETLYAVAGGTGFADSPVGSAAYVLRGSTPTFSPPAGTYTGAQTVTITP